MSFTVICERCLHPKHIGECGQDVLKDHVTTPCICVMATPSSTNRHELRTNDVIQRADVREMEQEQWNSLSTEKQRKIRSRPQYRRMKPS